MNMKDRIAARLEEGLAPSRLEIVDESHKHAGHSGARAGGETHYSVDIVSDAFQGKSRVARHRMVYALLESEFAAGVHALALKTHSPGEA
jgi:BolA family transcriptional regulator, general stress-responsive regulator